MRATSRPGRSAGFTLVEIMVALALVSTLILMFVEGPAGAERLFEQTGREARDQGACQLAMEHLTRSIREANVVTVSSSPGETWLDLECPEQGEDPRPVRYEWIPGVDGGPGELRFSRDRRDPATEVVLVRGVRVAFRTDPGQADLITIRIEADTRAQSERTGRSTPIALSSGVWKRHRGLLMKVYPARVEGAES